MNTRQILCLVEFFGVLLFLFYAILNLGWYIDEISAFFFMAMVVAGILSGYSATDICKTFTNPLSPWSPPCWWSASPAAFSS